MVKFRWYNYIYFVNNLCSLYFVRDIPEASHAYNLLLSKYYPACCRVGRGGRDFPPNSKGMAYWVAKLNADLCLDIRTKKWKYTFRYFLSEWGSNPQSVASHTCASAPRMTSLIYTFIILLWCKFGTPYEISLLCVK